MITVLILIFTSLNSPLMWSAPVLVFFSYGVAGVVTGLMIYQALRGRMPRTMLDQPLTLVLGIASLSTLFSTWRDGSTVRLLTIMAYGVGFYFVYMYAPRDILIKNMIMAGWIIIPAILICGIVGAKTLYGMGNLNVLASIILLLWPFGSTMKNRRLKIIWFAFGIAAMIATRSRGGLLGMAVALGILSGIGWQPMALAIFIASPVLFLWKPGTAMIRLCYWRAALEAWWARPIIGIGPGALYQWITPICGECPHAHNLILTVLGEMGLIGLAALLLLMWRIYQHRRPGPEWAALCGFMMHSLVDDPVWFWAPGLGVMTILAIMLKGENENATV